MYDVRLALTDMAQQLKACRSRDGLTLQQLATRCGVAASTIHKIEAQQMVPTVSVLLKIARGLGRRPEELVRDRHHDEGSEPDGVRRPDVDDADADGSPSALFDRGVAAWRVDYAHGERLASISLAPGQRAILFVERGQGELSTPSRRTRLGVGECIEIDEGSFSLASEPVDPVAALLIASPAGRLSGILGPPNAAPRPHSRPAPRPEPGVDGLPQP